MIQALTNAHGAHLAAAAATNRRLYRLLALAIFAGTVLALGGCGGGGATRDVEVDGGPSTSGDFGATSQFPVPPEIHPNVDFWRHVYGVWSRNQVAFHDDEHMGVIYEVARIPGTSGEGYNGYQKDWMRAREQYHRDRVRDLEMRVRSGQTLSADDRELLAKFERAGGAHTLYGASERVHSQRGLRERFRRGLEISGRYDRSFREIMRANGVPEDLAYLPHVESSFQTNARSSVGAAGVWQFMPGTGKIFMDMNGAVDERLDPILASEGAARYLSQAHAKLRSWPLAITSYNHGVGGMAAAKAQYGDDIGRIVKGYQGRAFKFASRNFYSEFMAAREVARNANRYFPEGVHYEQPWPHDRLVLRSPMPAYHVARHYGVSTGSLGDLNLHWRDSARSGSRELPSGTTVWLPAGSMRRVASHPPAYSAPTAVARREPERETVPSFADASPSTLRPEPAVARRPRSEPVVARRGAEVSAREVGFVKVSQASGPAKTSASSRKSSETRTPEPAKKSQAAKAQSKAPPAKESKSSPKTAKAAKAEKPAKAKYHAVKPEETLYRVATINGISVAELRKLNKMGPKDNNIRPGQKLKVSM